MPLFTIPYPAIDPNIIAFGPFAIRWYAIAYIMGLVLGWRYCVSLVKRPPLFTKPEILDDFLVWATLGVILGGRLGYVLFYKPSFFIAHPLEIFQVWHGGMAFHGGALGVILAVVLFARQRGISMLRLGDVIVSAVPIGLFFGRIANFINGELWGRVTDVPWAMVFPTGGPFARHPSQLYEAALEGLLLFAVVNLLGRFTAIRERPGALSGVFLIGYGVARSVSELFREPDDFMGFLFGSFTMGQLLSAPLFIAGIFLIARSWVLRSRRAA